MHHLRQLSFYRAGHFAVFIEFIERGEESENMRHIHCHCRLILYSHTRNMCYTVGSSYHTRLTFRSTNGMGTLFRVYCIEKCMCRVTTNFNPIKVIFNKGIMKVAVAYLNNDDV